MMHGDIIDRTMMNLHLMVLLETRNMMIRQPVPEELSPEDVYVATVEQTDYRFVARTPTGSRGGSSGTRGVEQTPPPPAQLQQDLGLFWIGQPVSLLAEQGLSAAVLAGLEAPVPQLDADQEGQGYVLESFSLPPRETQSHTRPVHAQDQRADRALGIYTYTCTTPWGSFSTLLTHMATAMLKGCITDNEHLPPLPWQGMQLHTTCILRLPSTSGPPAEVFRGVCVTEKKLAWEKDIADRECERVVLQYKARMAYLRKKHCVFKNPDLVHCIALAAWKETRHAWCTHGPAPCVVTS